MDASITLPVSGIGVEVAELGGYEDVLLTEIRACDTALALELVERVARPIGRDVEWSALTVSDLDALVLHIRRAVLADIVRTTVRCRAQACGERVDIRFGIGEYLAHHRPRRARQVEAEDEPGWYALRDRSARFRLPSGADMVALRACARPEIELRRRCIQPEDAGGAVLRRVQRAMEALAPNLAGDLVGTCAECGEHLALRFDPQRYCLRELRMHAASVYDDVHVLATAYGWTEPDILALPRARRARYAELVRGERRES